MRFNNEIIYRLVKKLTRSDGKPISARIIMIDYTQRAIKIGGLYDKIVCDGSLTPCTNKSLIFDTR